MIGMRQFVSPRQTQTKPMYCNGLWAVDHESEIESLDNTVPLFRAVEDCLLAVDPVLQVQAAKALMGHAFRGGTVERRLDKPAGGTKRLLGNT